MMYIYKTSILVSIILFSTLSLHALDSENLIREEIRRKIENIEIDNTLENAEKVYAIFSVKNIYVENDFRPLWNKPKEISEFILEIENAFQEGLNPNDYHYMRLSEIQNIAELSLNLKAEQDILLTDAFLLYATHLLSGKVDPVTIDADWHVTRREGDPIKLFNATIKSNNYNSTINQLIPNNKKYEDLKTALENYRKIQREGGWTTISNGKSINVGISDPRILLVKRRLAETEDYLKYDESDTSSVYKDDLYVAVLKFQRRHGFKGDGIIDEPTVRTMNIPVEERIKQIELNLERWRWMPQEFSKYYVIVNIANYELEIIKDGKVERTHKIIAGKPVRNTPIFSSTISYLVFNPTWTVPPTILNNDMIPEVRKSIQYLKDKNIKVLDANGRQLNIDSINWNNNSVKNLTYRQDPGPKNALGAVKFMFPNKFNVYLHDTPSRELFAKTERAFSSGCIRVEDPLILAEYLLNDPVKWNSGTIKKLISSNNTQTINLKIQPNVHILYWTCWANNGLVHFRKDIYERDEILYKALKESPNVDVELYLSKR